MRSASLEEFNTFAREFAASLAPRNDGANVVALSGELGAGKTAFVQEAARYLGVEERVTSPTFVIEKIYDVPMMDLRSPSFRRLVHIDAYRLKSAHELEVLGWKELVADPGTLIFLEWPERVPELVPEGALRLHFEIEGEGRIITVDGHGQEIGERAAENREGEIG